MANYIYVTLNGIIVPDLSGVELEVQGEWTAQFGAALDLSYNTPQGQMISMEVIARQNVIRNNALVANQINPNLATGVQLAAIGALTGSYEAAATPSVVTEVLTGTPDLTVPVGSQIKTSAGDIFRTTTTVILDSLGNGTVSMQSLELGPIPAPANTLTNLIAGLVPLGLETATNPAPAVLGVTAMSDAAFRAYRIVILGAMGSGLAASITAAVAAVPGTTSQRFLENKTSSTMVIQGVTLVPHSMWSCVAGGVDTDIAVALDSKKDGGCDYNGAVMVPVTDPSSLQTQIVQFDRPVLIPVAAIITARADTGVVNPTQSIIQAVLDYAAGLIDGLNGFVVGASVSPFEIAGGIIVEYPGIYVQNVEVTLLSPLNFQPEEIPLMIFQQATIEETSISVVLI